MPGKINPNELIDSKSFIKQLNLINKELKETSNALILVAESSKTLNEQFKKSENTQSEAAKSTKKVTDNLDVLAKKEIEIQKIKKKTTDLITKASAERSNEAKTLEKVKIARAAQNKKIKEEIKLDKAAKDSRKALRVENKKLRDEIDGLSTTKAEDIKKTDELNSKINENTELINSNLDSTRQQATQIGAYNEQLKDLFPALGNAGEGVKGLGRQFRKLLLNPILLFIAAIVVAITTLVKAFKRSREGSTTFSKAFAVINAAIDTTLGKLTEFTTKVKAAFDKGGIQGVFDGVKKSFSSFAKTVKEEGVFAAIKQDVQGTINGFKKLKDEIDENAKAATKIVDIENTVFDLNIELSQSIALLNKSAEEQRSIADDSTKSHKERETAAQAARVASEEAAKQQLSLRNAELTLTNERLILAEKTNKYDEALITQRNNALIAQIEAEKELTLTIRENEKQRGELRRDRLERDLDILIDGFDNVKTINEQKISNDKLTFNERQKILDQTVDASDNSFNEQIKIIKKLTKAKFDENALIAEEDAKRLNAKIRELELDNIAEGRLLEIFKERRLAIQDLTVAQEELTDQVEIQAQREIEIELEKQAKIKNERDKAFNEDLKREQELRKAKVVLINELFEFTSVLRDRQLTKLDENEQKQLEIAGDNEEKKEKIEKKFAKKRAEIQRKQAISDKVQSIFNATINTAVAVTKVLANPILAALVAAAGAIQIAGITAQPIPKFAKGVIDFAGGQAVVGEEGKELIKTNSGLFISPDKPTLIDLPKGSDVIPHHETMNILQGNNDKKLNELINETKQTRQALLNRPEEKTSLTHQGLKRAYSDSRQHINYIDTYFRK